MAFTKVVGAGIHTLSNIASHNINSSGIITATKFVGPMENTSGISTFYDLKVTNNLTVEGTTTTLDTNLIDVDRVEIGANSDTNTAIVGIQSGSADIVNLFDGTTEVLTVKDGGLVGINRTNPDQRLNVSGNIEVNAYDNSGGNDGYKTSGGFIIGNAFDAEKLVGVNSVTDDRNAIIWQERGLDLDFATNDTWRMKLTYDGKLGIGITNPNDTVHVYHATDNYVAKFESGDAGGGIVLKDNTHATTLLSNNGAFEIDVDNGGDVTGESIAFKMSGSEKLLINSGGDVILGGHTGVIEPGGYASHLEIHGTGTDAGISVLRYNNSAGGPTLVFGKSRNATIGSITKVQEDDNLGKIEFYGVDTDWEPGASIRAFADGEWRSGSVGSEDNTDSPGRLEFHTTPNGSDNLQERLRIDSSGKLFLHGNNATGTNNSTTRLPNGYTFNIAGNSSEDGISVVRYNTGYGCYGLNIGRSRSNTVGTNAAVADNDELGHISFYGANGSGFSYAAQITAIVDGEVGTGGDGSDMPGALSFRTTNDGSGSSTEKLRITSDGKLLIGIDASTSSNSYMQVFKKTGDEATITVGNVDTSASGLCRVDFCPSNSTIGARIECHATEDFSLPANRTADLVFVTRKDGTNAEKLRINSTGNVGIATDISGGGGAYGRLSAVIPSQSGGSALQVMNSAVGSGDGSLTNIVLRSVNNPGTQWAGAEYRAQEHIFTNQTTEALRITSDGALGIGNLQTAQNTSTTHTSKTKFYLDSTKFTKIARLAAGNISSAGWFTVAKIASSNGNYFKCYASIGGDFCQDMCVMELTGSWSASGGLSNAYAEPVFKAHRVGAHSTDRITRARFVKDSSNVTYLQIYIASGHSSYWGKSVLEYQIGTYSQNTADSGSDAMFEAGGTVTNIRTLEVDDNALCTNAGSHKIYTGGDERLTITSGGKTIISSPNAVAQTPVAILDVFNQGTTTQALRVYRNDLNDNTLAAFESYHNALGIVPKMVITSRGRVGINTNNPQRELHVKPWDNNPATNVPGYIRIEGNGSDQAAILELYHTRGNGSDKWPSSIDTVDGGLTFRVATGNNGTPQEKVRITSTGAVCVGSGYKSGGGGHLTIRGGGINTYACQDYQYVGTPSDDDTLAQIRFTANTTGASVIQGAVIKAVADADWSTSGDAPTRLEFYTAPDGSATMVERLRIESDGQVIVTGGGTRYNGWAGSTPLNVASIAMVNVGNADTNNWAWGLRGNSGDTQWCLERIKDTTSFADVNIKFRVYQNGNYLFAGTDQSDRDIKENILDISGTSLDKIKQLKPRTFNFIESEGYSTETKTGFIAQEVASVIPSITNGTDGQKDMGVDYNGLVAHLVKAVQELSDENTALKARISALEGS